jgi:hypothetical protein
VLFEVSAADVRSVRRTIGGTRMAELPATRHPWSDAWLLFSFPELITRADGIQHAVPSFDEVDGGLARLSSAGLVRVSRGHVGLTPGGLALVSRTASPRRPLLNWQEELERALKAAPWSAEYTPVTAHRDPRVAAVTSREEYAEALRRSGR